ncbi:MAG TPA: histidine kinase dimerization/phosphoacceptor domain -containing protein [Alkalispirochaeta sp.]|nr:histidine kinase dimerization/phosphoacceptor domain -containing protein [Alkalispirochaeta sp.]
MGLERNQKYPAELYRDIVTSSGYSYLVFEHGVCTYASPSYWSVVGYHDTEELDTAATALRELLHPEDRDAVLLAFSDAVHNQEPEISMTYRGRCKDGTYVLRHDLARLMYDSDGRHVKTYVAVQRVPATQAAQQEVLIKGHARLLGELLHRTKNDLAMVRSMLHLQAVNTSSSEAGAALRAAEDRIAAVGHIYDQLHQSGRIRDSDIAHMLTGFLNDLLGKTGIKHASLDVAIPSGVVVSARISTSVAIMLNEVVTNAAKYAHSSGSNPPTDELAVVAALDADGQHMAIQVRDHGPGFPQHVLDGSRWGFGLEMVQALASQHGGTVHFSIDHGAVVDIMIPLDPDY